MIQRSLEVVAGGDYENGTLLGIHSAQGMEAKCWAWREKKKKTELEPHTLGFPNTGTHCWGVIMNGGLQKKLLEFPTTEWLS